MSMAIHQSTDTKLGARQVAEEFARTFDPPREVDRLEGRWGGGTGLRWSGWFTLVDGVKRYPLAFADGTWTVHEPGDTPDTR